MTLNNDNQDNNIFDIVILVGPNDNNIIQEQIKYNKKNIIDYRNIYLICYDPEIKIDNCITINENIFPFNKETVAKYHGKLKQNGWYFQQLLKLYAGKVIPGILDNYLVIDADTIFLKSTIFVEKDIFLYNYSSQYHKLYFYHMARLDPELIRMDLNKSGISHHMMFETKYLDELFSKIEKKHNDYFYNIFLKLVQDDQYDDSGASEYEIYFNYMLKNHPNKIKLRKLDYIDTGCINTNVNLDYISVHWYKR